MGIVEQNKKVPCHNCWVSSHSGCAIDTDKIIQILWKYFLSGFLLVLAWFWVGNCVTDHVVQVPSNLAIKTNSPKSLSQEIINSSIEYSNDLRYNRYACVHITKILWQKKKRTSKESSQHVSITNSEQKKICQFWDERARAYAHTPSRIAPINKCLSFKKKKNHIDFVTVQRRPKSKRTTKTLSIVMIAY